MLDDYLTNNVSLLEFSVSEISSKIKWLLENNFEHVKIKGEISGLKIATSGHGYFSLKDENAILEKSTDPEMDYINIILPDKIKYNLIFIEKNNAIEYLKIIFVTIWKIIF